MFHDFGFEAVFFTRFYRPMQDYFRHVKKSVFVWEPNKKNVGTSKQILGVHLMPHYAWPEGFQYEEKYDMDTPVIGRKDDPHYNLNLKCEILMNQTQLRIGEQQ
jgi:hypothetical protein